MILAVLIILAIVALIAWLLAINLLIKVGAAKGYAMDNKGLLWFIGIFATPIVVGLYIASLPDNRVMPAESAAGSEAPAEELPAL